VSRVRILPGPPRAHLRTEPMSQLAGTVPAMRQARIGTILVDVPETGRERRRGLRRGAPLAAEQGLLLERCRSVHTFGVRYPIDVVLLDRSGVVLRVVRMAPRRVLLPRPRVRHVLEVPVGAAPRIGTRLPPLARHVSGRLV
jgi:uncharacterized membrane protein (UPF0127 family)